jgi:hypothetical protein
MGNSRSPESARAAHTRVSPGGGGATTRRPRKHTAALVYCAFSGLLVQGRHRLLSISALYVPVYNDHPHTPPSHTRTHIMHKPTTHAPCTGCKTGRQIPQGKVAQ